MTYFARLRARHRTHYPLKKAEAFSLAVSGGHRLYGERYGNPNGRNALFLHGGPGSGCHNSQKCLFDSKKWNLILFDQRASGKSTADDPYHDNTTQALIEDIEAIRHQFDIASWIIVGGSWGATLALAYAIDHPDHVDGLVLRSVFLADKQDTLWAFFHAAQTFRPELWDWLCRQLGNPPDPIATMQNMLVSSDESTRLQAAQICRLMSRHFPTIRHPSHYRPYKHHHPAQTHLSSRAITSAMIFSYHHNIS